MTERYHSLTVVLNEDTREDDVQALTDAIMMLKGVASVTGAVASIDSHMALERTRMEFGAKLLELCYPKLKR